jgi:hypothetical protein
MNYVLCHDFKTPRPDASKRLPRIFVVVPIMFYVVLLLGTYMSVTSYLSYRDALQRRDQWQQYQAGQDEAKAGLESQKAAVDYEKWKAEKLAQWIEGTRAVQPISVAVTRSVPPETSLSELSLERSSDLPQQILLSVRINSGTLEDVAKIQNAIGALSYRAYNSQQLKTGDLLDYRSMLVWQRNSAATPAGAP